jgi:7-carboxy-7-deazaguanine synthase
MLNKYSLNEKCSILFSPTFGKIDPSLIVEWILEGDIPVRMQLQMHKHIWESEGKGV